MPQTHAESTVRRDLSSRPRTMASRREAMAAALVRLRQDTGSASEDDLKREGFSAAEIDAYGEEARADAAKALLRAGR